MMNQDVCVGIVGASGYSGEELIRLLLRHERVQLKHVTSRQYAGQPLGTVFPRFADVDLCFVEPDVEAIAADVDCVFLALPHGLAAEFARPFYEKGVTVIDISADFRLRDTEVYAQAYGKAHPAPDCLAQAVYGLAEIYRESIASSGLIACPGCYPTSILLPLIPLLQNGLLKLSGIVASSMSGVSGAGRKVDLPFIFPECNESVRLYGAEGHRHLPEIRQELTVAAGDPVSMVFMPHLVPVNRGIASTIVADLVDGAGVEEVRNTLQQQYGNEPFVRVLAEGKLADTKHVTMSNVAEIGAVQERESGRLVLSSAIDNLTKGAAGQAVQCMNISFGYAEQMGLV